MMFVDSL